MGGLRLPELIFILLIVLLLFGANKLPQIGAGLGQSIRGFKKALNGEDEKPTPPSSSQPSDPGAPKP
jgi:sec-independent protein translocase protein TatA